MSIHADHAQILRGPMSFGAVAYHDGGAIRPDQLVVNPGYADCLPLIGGGCWRDPAKPVEQETLA